MFKSDNIEKWPDINEDLLIENKIKLPIQIHGKLVTTIDTTKGYSEEEILKTIYQLDKIKIKYKIRKLRKLSMFKIKLLILLLISYLISSCINNAGDYKFKMNVAYIGGEYEGLILSNQLKSQLNNFRMLDKNSQYEVQANIAHSRPIYHQY